MSSASLSVWFTHFRKLGVMRWFLFAASLALILAVPAPGTRAVLHGPAVFPTVIVPALAPILFMVVLLDALMSAVFMADKTGEERTRMKLSLVLHLLLAGLMVIAWYPYFRALVTI
jgi:hypothetical protein